MNIIERYSFGEMSYSIAGLAFDRFEIIRVIGSVTKTFGEYKTIEDAHIAILKDLEVILK